MAQNTERQAWMSVLSTAEPAALRTCFAELGDRPGFTWLRAPEFGAVMVRGRAGGTGSAFNLGEMTVTRCTLRLDTGEVGHAYLPGREAAAAEAAALCDALMQSDRAQDVRGPGDHPAGRGTGGPPRPDRAPGRSDAGRFLHHGKGRGLMETASLEGGFAAPPVDAAAGFRAALTAMSRPGQVQEVGGALPPAPMSVAAGVLALTLCDPETPVWLAPSLAGKPIRDWFAFHTGAPTVSPAEAAFAFGTWAEMPLDAFRPGDAAYPDRSATLIVEVAEIGSAHRLTGPGIERQAHLTVPDPAWSRANRARYPLGLDLFLTSGTQLAALPRTTKVEG